MSEPAYDFGGQVAGASFVVGVALPVDGRYTAA